MPPKKRPRLCEPKRPESPKPGCSKDLAYLQGCSKDVAYLNNSTKNIHQLMSVIQHEIADDSSHPHAANFQQVLANIHSVSDKELLQIFSYLSLNQQIHVERVCPRWQEFSITSCRDQTTLSLVQEPTYTSALTEICRYFFFTEQKNWLRLEERNVFIKKRMTTTEVDWLGQRFPRVKHLILLCVDHLSVEMFVRLVENYPELETLELFCSDTQKREYYCDEFWDAIDHLEELKWIHLPFDYQQMGENRVLDRLYNRVTMLFHRSSNTRPERENLSPDQPGPSPKLSPLQRCCLMDEDGRLGQFLLRFDHRPLPDDPINAVITGLGLYSGHIQIRELSQRLNLVKFGTLVMNNEANLTHIDLDVPCNVNLAPFLAHLSTLRVLTDLRITARRDPQTLQQEQLFSNLTLENYRATLTPVIHRLRNLTLSRFAITRGDFLLTHYLPYIFPQLNMLHFEDCRLQRFCTLYYEVFTVHFTKLQYVWHNNHILLEIEQPVEGEPEEVAIDRKERMMRKIPQLYRKRARFAHLHEVARRANGNFRINGAEFMEEFNRRRGGGGGAAGGGGGGAGGGGGGGGGDANAEIQVQVQVDE